ILQIFLDPIPSDEIKCYIHGVSNVKSSGKTNYFSCQLQTESSGVVRAVCFSPEKRQVLEQYEEKKSPVKLSKFRINEKEGSKDVIINKYTNVIKAEETAEFKCTPLPNSCVLAISSVNQVATGQLVSLRAKVAQLSSVKVINTTMGPLRKQEAQVVDKTGCIKLILWEDEVDVLDIEKTYVMKNIRVKQNQGEKYVNTAKGEKFLYEETEAYDEVVEVEDYECPSEAQIFGTVVGVRNVAKYYSCFSCSKKVIVDARGKIGNCSSKSCNMVQKVSSCNSQWFMKVMIQPEDTTEETVALSAFHEGVCKLASLSEDIISVASACEDELVRCILSVDKVKVTYEAGQNKLIDCELATDN
ncbi:Hypothetical predicted protein, partial [Paramuricea clavata]